VSDVHASDVIIRGTNLGSCTHYSDGCNECSVGTNGQAACTKRACFWEGIPSCLDATGATLDTQIVDLNTKNELKTDFKLQTFSSCENMESKLRTFIEGYYRYHPNGYPRAMDDVMLMEDAVIAAPTNGMATDAKSTSSTSPSAGATGDYSQTNIQVA